MPKNPDINSVLVIGSGPIVIGQACEFDYSGTQACLTLKREGCRVILVNSNPATIMTDPQFADRTYIEPLDARTVEKIIAKERPDAILPTMGGQTALNVAVELAKNGTLERYGVRLIGCDLDTIERGEDRKLFHDAMQNIGLEMCRSDYAYSLEDARRIVGEIGYPVVIRPSFTLGGAGGGIAHNASELDDIVSQGLELSPAGEVLVEESIEGWKEFEMEAMRDKAGNGIIVCSIENLDPMGVHTGDSITVAPIQTLTDVEYQAMRDATLAILDVVGVESGGSNVQFAVNPEDGRMVVIEMNPRVSRSSALASKATGYPIAKVATRLALGYTLDELMNDVTRTTTAAFEPSIDYCVVKVPRFAFEKFPGCDDTLTTRMKSVGEVMAIGRTFEEALGKALRSLEKSGSDATVFEHPSRAYDDDTLAAAVRRPSEGRLACVFEALHRGWSVERVHELSRIDPYFLERIRGMVALQEELEETSIDVLGPEDWAFAKKMGLSDRQLGSLLHVGEARVRAARKAAGVVPVFRMVDTCAAEFGSETAYYYKTYDTGGTDLHDVGDRCVMILGSGPNRIGQGIEFDYCCVQACFALHDAGFHTMMVNCNPETVSTDYSTADTLVFEPLTFEDVMDIIDECHPYGVIVSLGGQTPLKLAKPLTDAGVPILGTSYDAIDCCEDRERFAALLEQLRIVSPTSGMASTLEEAHGVARRIGYPLIVRPSYVLGGQGMAIVHDGEELERYVTIATEVSDDRPIYLDKFLESAVEVDVDALCDGKDVYIGGVMEHIEMAGVHSGDSSSSIPPSTLSDAVVERLREQTAAIALTIQVKGLINVQFAIKESQVYVIEANPRASRTVPFISKASGVSLAKAASLVMTGATIAEQHLPSDRRDWGYCCAKEAVIPWERFAGAKVVLGPEMKSTGEVMGIAATFPEAFAKAQLATSYPLPTSGVAFVSVCDADKRSVVSIARELERLGFSIVSTKGTGQVLRRFGIPCEVIGKVHEGPDSIVSRMANGQVDLVINTPFGSQSRGDGDIIRSAAVRYGIFHMTTIAGAEAAVAAIDMMKSGELGVVALQDIQQSAEDTEGSVRLGIAR